MSKYPLQSIDRAAIANYAKGNANKHSPDSGGFNVPYYDFSQIPGNWDCTNFVSHSLLAGGAAPYNTNRGRVSPTGWYYKNLNDRSSSWSGVNNLHDFIVNNKIEGPTGYSVEYAPLTGHSSWEIGDIIQFYLSSDTFNNWRHSTIITGRYAMSIGRRVYGALVTGRSADGSYNYNQPAENIYPGSTKRVIILTGSYSSRRG